MQNIKVNHVYLLTPPPVVHHLISHVVQEKYEQRRVSGDIFDDYVAFLSGDLCDGGGQSIKGKNMEVSYTKEQQKQRQKQQNKNKVAYILIQYLRVNGPFSVLAL